MKKKLMVITALTVAILGSSCMKDKDDVVNPNNPNEVEMISTILLSANNSETNKNSTGIWKDTDGDGISNIVDTLFLEENSDYDVELLVLNDMRSPADTISHEIEEEASEHQFFYTATGVNINIAIIDFDKNNVPLGLKTKINTSTKGRGQIRILLKHQPEDKPKTGDGDPALGSTDIDILLPVVVR